jgi:hypothetical protein
LHSDPACRLLAHAVVDRLVEIEGEPVHKGSCAVGSGCWKAVRSSERNERGGQAWGGGTGGWTWPPRARCRRSRSQSRRRRSVPAFPGNSGMAARLHSHDRNLAAAPLPPRYQTRSAPRCSGVPKDWFRPRTGSARGFVLPKDSMCLWS